MDVPIEYLSKQPYSNSELSQIKSSISLNLNNHGSCLMSLMSKENVISTKSSPNEQSLTHQDAKNSRSHEKTQISTHDSTKMNLKKNSKFKSKPGLHCKICSIYTISSLKDLKRHVNGKKHCQRLHEMATKVLPLPSPW